MVVSDNIRHLRLLNQRYHEEGGEHFDILLSAQVSLRDLLRIALRFLGRHTAEDVKNNILWLNE
jgi:hypothetical protein